MNSLFISFFSRIGAYQNQILMHNILWIAGDRDFHNQFSKEPFNLHNISSKIYGLFAFIVVSVVSSPCARSQISSRFGH